MKFNLLKIILIPLFLIFHSFSFSQKITELARFTIKEATINGVDETDFYLDQDAYVVFYTKNDKNSIHMANFCQKDNTQSYGPLNAIKSKNYKETKSTYEAKEFIFNWRFTNDYDGKTGTSKVVFTKIFLPRGITFSIKIYTKEYGEIVFKGNLEGNIDFLNY
jgi:hypothetical protein